jgi:DNA-binding ferritin-like protein
VIGLAEEYRQELRDPRDETIEELTERIRTLEAEAVKRESPRVVKTDDPGASAPIRTTRQMFDALESRYQETDDKALAMLAALKNVKHGKALEGATPRERLAAEAEKLFAERRAEREAKKPKVGQLEQLAAFDKRLMNWRSTAEKNAADTLAELYSKDEAEEPAKGEQFTSMLASFEKRLDDARKRARKKAAQELSKRSGGDYAGD